MLSLAASTFAVEVEIDGLWYDLVSKAKSATVIQYKDYDVRYRGDIVIPQTIEYEATTYSVTSIGSEAFEDCSGLTSITIPNSVTNIGGSAFSGCSGLTSVTIGNSVTSIGSSAFFDCSSLTSVAIGNSVTDIGDNAFYGCSSLTSVTIPNSVTSIGEYAFSGCSSLTSVTIPNSVTDIGYYAFSDCSGLTSVTIPNSVTSIGDYAFSGCKELTDVYCYADMDPQSYDYYYGEDLFKDSYIEYATLHVPAASIEAYKATVPWSGFGKIVALEGGGAIETPKCATPTISYANGKLSFTSETEGAEFISEITDADIKKHYDSEIQLSAAYNISVYATKSGYDNSDVVTATLYFTSASLNDPSGISSAKASAPILIQKQGTTLHVSGIDDGAEVEVFGLNGGYIGHSKSFGGTANIEMNAADQIVIVKVGNDAIKVKL